MPKPFTKQPSKTPLAVDDSYKHDFVLGTCILTRARAVSSWRTGRPKSFRWLPKIALLYRLRNRAWPLHASSCNIHDSTRAMTTHQKMAEHSRMCFARSLKRSLAHPLSISPRPHVSLSLHLIPSLIQLSNPDPKGGHSLGLRSCAVRSLGPTDRN